MTMFYIDDLHEPVVDTTGGDTTGKVDFTTPGPVVDTTGSKYEIIEPDYKRAYYILARLVAQAYENTDENSEAVEDYVKRAMEFVENTDNSLTQKV